MLRCDPISALPGSNPESLRLWRCETLGDALQRRAHVADIECRVEVSPEHVEEAILREIAARHFSDEEEVGFADVGGELFDRAAEVTASSNDTCLSVSMRKPSQSVSAIQYL